ncbi:ADP-ribosylglycohydrolase family protein [Companilactobacillus sp. HBUAS59544]|uniref:ADP-ribosylglycohydrolase family protein n=1 Tax=Companilactobacillus sp. HBUAS59544 TaxID=3109363 RepID=UPI002FF37A1F
MYNLKNILYAAVVGDALGVPVEFKKRDTYYIDKMTSGGTWEQKPGSWSDDTSFTLPLMENLVEHGDYDQLMQKFENYMFRNQYTPDGEAFGIGQGCAKAIRNWSINHYPALKCGDPSVYANGNGALMRLAPLAIHLRKVGKTAQRLELTRNYTCLTHRHPRSVMASFIYLEILHFLLNGEHLTEILKKLPNHLESNLQDYSEEWNEFTEFADIFQPKFKQTNRQDIKSTGYVVDTLQACLWCALNATSVDEAVLLAVNLGDDTDTIASITATLASCMYPNDQINPRWVEQLRNKTLLDSIIDPFVQMELKNSD